MSAKIWAYGPHMAFPDFDFGLPPAHAKVTAGIDSRPLSHPAHSPMYGIDLLSGLKQYGCDLHVSQYIGTEDLFYEQNLRLERSLQACDISHTLRIVRSKRDPCANSLSSVVPRDGPYHGRVLSPRMPRHVCRCQGSILSAEGIRSLPTVAYILDS
jgi:hypothetical protein